MRLWIDDQLDPPKIDRITQEELTWVTVRTAADAIAVIKTGDVEFIDFDHDLAGEKTGYDVAKFIERMAYKGKLKPIHYQIHSGNIAGASNIDKAMKSAWRFWEAK